MPSFQGHTRCKKKRKGPLREAINEISFVAHVSFILRNDIERLTEGKSCPIELGLKVSKEITELKSRSRKFFRNEINRRYDLIVPLIYIFRRYWMAKDDDIDYVKFPTLEKVKYKDIVDDVYTPVKGMKTGSKGEQEEVLDFHLYFYHDNPELFRHYLSKINDVWNDNNKVEGSCANLNSLELQQVPVYVSKPSDKIDNKASSWML